MCIKKLFIASFLLVAFLQVSAQSISKNIDHVVKDGETLYSLALSYNVSVQAIEQLNPSLTDVLKIGSHLLIPNTQKNIFYHTIVEGETLYSLSQKYKVSISSICQMNPGLSAVNFRIGTIIIIPEKNAVNTIVTKKEEELKMEKERNRALANSDCRDMHKIKRRDNLYKIAKKYGVTIEELLKANPDIESVESKLKKGDFICIPYHHKFVEVKVQDKKGVKIPSNKEIFDSISSNIPVAQNKVRAALIMPLTSSGAVGIRTLEFYQGFLLAVDSLKSLGLSVDVLALPVEDTRESLENVLNHKLLPYSDFIIGPVYLSHVNVLSKFARKHNIKLVIPFSSKVNEVYDNPDIFMLNAPSNYKAEAAINLIIDKFQNSHFVILTKKNGNKKEFIEVLEARLKNNGISYTEVSDYANLEAIKASMKLKTPNVILPNSDDLNTLNDIMANLITIKQDVDTIYNFNLLGYPQWQTYIRTQLDNFYILDTYIYTSFYANPLSDRTYKFKGKFQHAFHKEMMPLFPRMGMLGYDCGYYFLSGFSMYGKGFSTQNIKYNPLQNSLNFLRVNNWGGMVNNSMHFIHYHD